MSAFSIAPITNVPPPAAQEFPEFLQLQNQGADLGGRDADTINFSTGLTATRGVGENSNVVTVTAEGGGGGASFGVIELTTPAEFVGEFNTFPFPDVWDVSVLVANAAWEFDATNILTFLETGVYRITATCRIVGDGGEGSEWPTGETRYGSNIDGGNSTQFRRSDVDVSGAAVWTDQAVITVTSAPDAVQVRLYAESVDNSVFLISTGEMTLVVERLGDAP